MPRQLIGMTLGILIHSMILMMWYGLVMKSILAYDTSRSFLTTSSTRRATKHVNYRPRNYFHGKLNLVKLDFNEIGYSAVHRSDDDEKMMSLCDVYLLEKKDLASIATLALNSFYKSNFDSLLDIDNSNNRQKGLWNMFVHFLMETERLDMYLSNYLGFWNRGGLRLKHPSLELSRDSIILVAKLRPGLNNIDADAIAGVIELGLEVPNGLLSPPLRNPFPIFTAPTDLDRKQAYLCNLCVDASCRRLGIGKLLCQVVEYIASDLWKKGYMGLHVEMDNSSAQRLYEQLDYMKCDPLSAREKRINGLQNILYYAKPL